MLSQLENGHSINNCNKSIECFLTISIKSRYKLSFDTFETVYVSLSNSIRKRTVFKDKEKPLRVSSEGAIVLVLD